MSAFAPVTFIKRPAPLAALFVLAGILPVTSIALHCAEIIMLKHALWFLIIPTFVAALASGAIDRHLLKLAFRGWIAGLVGVALYDLSRVPFILAGWADFIPHISSWLTESNPHSYVIGYAWRYAGNGGGLGIVFFLLADYFGWRKYIVSNGVTFGLLVFASLVALLVIFPHAQNMMFKITPLSFFGGLIGHVVYGYVLGKLCNSTQYPAVSAQYAVVSTQ